MDNFDDQDRMVKERIAKRNRLAAKRPLDGLVRRMEMIATDMENDSKELDGQPFNGRTVARSFGRQNATIATLADTIRVLLKKESA